MKVVLVSLLFLITTFLFAKTKSSPDVPKTRVAETIINYAEQTQSFISESWKDINYNVDSFFSNEIYAKEMNESFIRAELYSLYYQGAPQTTDISLSAKVDLSRSTKKFKFVIEQDNDLIGEKRGTSFKKTEGQLASSKVSSSLRYEILKSKDWHISSDFGTRITLPLDPFYKLMLRRSLFLDNNNGEIRFTPKLELFRQSLLFLSISADYQYKISSIYEFVWANQLSYRQDSNQIALSHTFDLNQKLSSLSALKYRLGIYASVAGVPDYHTVALSMKYRKELYKKWIFGQVVPGIDFKEQQSFYNLFASMEILF